MMEEYLGRTDVKRLVEVREMICLLAEPGEERRNEDLRKDMRPCTDSKKSSLSEQRHM